MVFQFQKFTETDKSFAARATIRQGTGQIGFSSGAVNRYHMEDYPFAVLYFDGLQRVVGIELSCTSVEGAIDLKISENNSYLRAKNFFDKLGIDYAISKAYDLKQDPETGFLYFEIDSPKIQARDGRKDTDVIPEATEVDGKTEEWRL